MLVPESQLLELREAWYHHMMHPGVKKQALDMQSWYEITEIRLYNAMKQVKKGCSVCQTCNPDNGNVKGEAQWTPVPDQPMGSVAMDVFSMPQLHIGTEAVGFVVLCLDRYSGYIVAGPARKKGLLAKEVAVMMIRHSLTVFAVPGTICGDHGLQFTDGWFKAMCCLIWGYGMPRASPLLDDPLAELNWLAGSCLRSCARSTPPKGAATGFRRCGQPLRGTMTPPHWVACHLIRFF